jgi:hypothetical protein
MPRKPPSERELQLRQAEAILQAEKAVLKTQQARVTAAKRAVEALCRCDCCGVSVQFALADDLLCWPCTKAQVMQRRQEARAALLQGSRVID